MLIVMVEVAQPPDSGSVALYGISTLPVKFAGAWNRKRPDWLNKAPLPSTASSEPALGGPSAVTMRPGGESLSSGPRLMGPMTVSQMPS